MPALTTVQRGYQARRGLVSRVVTLTFGLAAALMSPLFAWLLGRLGYAGLCLAGGGAALVTILAATPWCRLPGPGEHSPSLAAAPRRH